MVQTHTWNIDIDGATCADKTQTECVSPCHWCTTPAPAHCQDAACDGTPVTCWKCNGTTPESQTFPAGTVCGQGVAASWPYLSQPTCGGNDCTNPAGAEDSEACIDGFTHTCTGGTWVENSPQETCGGKCEDIELKADCTSPCFWYQKYIWEPEKCHSEEQNMLMDYLPIMIGGVVAVAVVGVLVSILGRRRSYQPPYYPPPYYPPPGGR